MTALTQDKGSLTSAKYGFIQSYTAGDATIYTGAIVVIRLTDGLLYPAVADADDSDRQLVVGYAREGGVLDDTVRVRRDGKYRLNYTGGTPLVGLLAVVVDDNTVGPYGGGGGNIVVGRIAEVISNQEVYVNFEQRPSRVASGQYD